MARAIIPCGIADYYRYLAQWSDSIYTTLVVLLQQWDTNQLLNTPLLVLYGIMHSCVTTHSPWALHALVLYVVTALVI